MTKLMIPAIALAFAVACTSKSGANDTGESGGNDSGTGGNPAMDAAWGTSAVTFTLSGMGNVTGFSLGMAQTDPSTGNPSDGWYGEDCLNGSVGFNICHHFSASSGTLTYLTGADKKPSNVTQSNTLFDDTMKDTITYMISVDGGDCFVTGPTPSYYSSKGCTAL